MTDDAALSEEATSRFAMVDIGGKPMKIHYNDVGQGNDVVVMLHGSGAGATGWANFHRNIAPLVESGRRVILMDCPGWGRSDTVICTGARSELNADALSGLLSGIGVSRVSIIGNSMGAHSAVWFTLAHPDRVSKLVLMGGGTGGPSMFTPSPMEGIKLLQGVYREPTIDNLKTMMGVFVYDASALTEAQMQMRLDNMLSRRDHLASFVESMKANPKPFPDQGARLGEIKAPTLIIWGRDDRFVPMDLGLRLLAGITNSEMHIFSRCGHWAQWEHAEAFNDLVAQFLARS